jgi:hypothetical protein
MGATWDNILILGPNRDYYQQLIAQFRETPAAMYPISSILQKAVTSAKESIDWVAEKLDMQFESLDDSGVTSAENNSSAITLLTVWMAADVSSPLMLPMAFSSQSTAREDCGPRAW